MEEGKVLRTNRSRRLRACLKESKGRLRKTGAGVVGSDGGVG